jgi:hypothetical protein
VSEEKLNSTERQKFIVDKSLINKCIRLCTTASQQTTQAAASQITQKTATITKSI